MRLSSEQTNTVVSMVVGAVITVGVLWWTGAAFGRSSDQLTATTTIPTLLPSPSDATALDSLLLDPSAAQSLNQLLVNPLADEVADLRRQIEQIQKAIPSDPNSPQLTGLTQSVTTLSDKMQRLEATIMESPDKAVAIPLLVQRINALETRFAGDINRIFDLNKWLIGGIALIVFVPVIQSLVTRKKATEEKADKPADKPS
jgi:hypothetical protein